MSIFLIAAVVLGTLTISSLLKADFHEEFEGPSIDLSNWTIMDYGGLDAVQANGELYVNGTYDPGDPAPGTNGWNQFWLIYKDNFTGFLDISVKDTITSFFGAEIGVGIGIMENNTVCWDNVTSWVQRYYLTENSIGWVDSWFNGSDVKITFDDTDITLQREYTHRMIHHENGTVQFILDGETKGWLPINLTSYYPFLVVAIKGAGTHIEAVFDDYHIITGPPTAVLEVSETNPTKQEEIVLTGNNSFYEGARIESYYFDFGNGDDTGWISSSYVFYNYSAEGMYEAKLKVRGDNGKESDWTSVFICVACGYPSANLSGEPASVRTFESVNFSANKSSDPDGSILGYYFDYGDGTSSGWIMSQNASHEYLDDGIYSAKLKVLDDDMHESNWSEPVTITVLNRPPSPRFWYSSSEINQAEFVTFDGSRSSDMDGNVISYFFDFGDGTDSGWVSLPNVTHFYQDVGNYMVSLLVQDDDGLVSDWSAVHQVTVLNSPPTAIVTVSNSIVSLGDEVTLDAILSYDMDGNIANYLFDFGDGTDSGWTIDIYVVHTYAEEGSYSVKAKVRDDDGAESVWSPTVQITVVNQLPVAFLNSTAIEAFVGEDIFFDGSGSYDPEGSIDGYRFDFGDGETTDWLTHSYVTHVFAEEGEYQVSLLVRDDFGAESEEEVSITIVVRQKEADLGLDFIWWIIFAIILVALLIAAILVILQQRKRIHELEAQIEEPEEQQS